MANQIYYQNLPIPQNMDSIPTYLNNELQILGTVISDINENLNNTTSLSSSSSNDTTELEHKVSNLEIEVSGISTELNQLSDEITAIEVTNSQIDTSINDLQSYVVNFNTDISNDNVISQSEKSKLFQDWKTIYTEYSSLLNDASTYSTVDTSSYMSAYAKLKKYLTSDPIYIPEVPTIGTEFCANAEPLNINGKDFRNIFVDYNLQKVLLVNSFPGAAKIAADESLTNSNLAFYTAQDAAIDAANALAMISAVASDNTIAQNEKNSIFIEWKSIYDEHTGITTQGTNAGVSTTAYTSAYSALATYLTSSPINMDALPTDGATWCADPNSISITGTVFRTKFADYFNARQVLLNSISSNYLNRLTDIASDNIISQSEKADVFLSWKSIYDEKPGITTQGSNASVSTTNYTTAYTNLANYLTASPISIDATPTDGATWCSNTSSITIVGTTFRTYFATYYKEKQLLLNAVSTAIKTISDTANSNASTALSNANTALTNANTAITGLSDKLSKTANSVLSGSGAVIAGTLVINSSGARTSGSGVALTSAGIAGYNSSGTATFAIDTSGNASFAGSLSAASGTFAGTLSSVNGTFTGTLSSVNGTFTGQLVAATGSFGAVTIGTSGSLSSGMTGYATGTGYWLDFNGGTPRFSVGAGTAGTITTGLSWNGSTLSVKGDITGSTGSFGGSLIVGGTAYPTSSFYNANVTATSVGLGNVSNLTPQNQAQTGLIAGTTITGGGITMSSGGTISGGKTSFTDTTNAGFILGYGAGGTSNQYGFKFGTADMSKGIYWDGSTLAVKGDITGSTGSFSGTLSVGTTPAVSGTTMTGSGAVFNSGGTFAVGNSTTNVSFNGTSITLNGSVVANGNLTTNAVTAVKVGANEVTTLVYHQVSPQLTVTTLNAWTLIDSVTFTVPTVGDGSTTIDVMIEIVGSVYDKSTTANSRTQIGTYIQRVSSGAYLREAIYSLWMNAANGTVAPTLPGSGGTNTLGATTDTTFTDKWINYGTTSQLTQGAQYTVGLKYFVATSGVNVIDHFTIMITVLKR
jgi:hypothetical protein